MVLENNPYPLDVRVRLEAESLAASGLSVEVLAPRQPGSPRREVIHGVRVRRFPLIDGQGRLAGTALEYLVAFCVISAAILLRLGRNRRGTLHVHNPPDLFFPLLAGSRAREVGRPSLTTMTMRSACSGPSSAVAHLSTRSSPGCGRGPRGRRI